MVNEVERLLLKYSVNAMARIVRKGELCQKREVFGLLVKKRKISKKIEKSGRIA